MAKGVTAIQWHIISLGITNHVPLKVLARAVYLPNREALLKVIHDYYGCRP